MSGNDEIFRIILDMGHSKETAQEMIDKLATMKGAGEQAGAGLSATATATNALSTAATGAVGSGGPAAGA